MTSVCFTTGRGRRRPALAPPGRPFAHRHLVALLLLSVMAARETQAQEPPLQALAVSLATADAITDTIIIVGANFGPRSLVTLDLIPLDVRLTIDTRIVVSAPIGAMPPGEYLLTVSRGPATDDSASRAITIGVEAAATINAAPTRLVEAAPSLAGTAIAATVGDRAITVSEVDREWQRTDPGGYFSLMRALYDNRRRAADTLVTDALLARESAVRGMTADALLSNEVPKRQISMPDSAVTSLYLSLGDRVRGMPLEQMRPALRAWLARHTEPELAKMNYIEELVKTSTRAEVILAAPRVRVERTPRDPLLGPETATIEIVAFGDLQSTDYVRMGQTFGRVRDTFGDRVRVVFKLLPMFGDESARVAAAAACAHAQGRFWAFHDAASTPGLLDAVRLKTLAGDVGLDRGTFDACIERGEFKDLPRQAISEAGRYGITRSPTFLINGRMAPDIPPFLPPFEYFKRLIEEELQHQAKEAVKAPR